jgi:hypothetical protein
VYCTRSTAKESGVDVLPDKCEYRLFNRKTIVTIVTVVIAQLDVCLEEIQWAIAASGLMHDLLDWLHEYLVNLHCCVTLSLFATVRLANDDTARGATIRRLEDLIQICTAVSSSFTGPAKLPFFKVLINLYKMLGALSKEVCLNRECLCCSVL